MGWASGTELFDDILSSLFLTKLSLFYGISDNSKVEAIARLIELFEEHDCDTLEDSEWITHPLARRAMQNIYPDWCQDD
jgi:hypothetical protein